MAFTRSRIRDLAKESGVELQKEFEDALVIEHLEARDAYAQTEIQKYESENKQISVKDSEEYKKLKQEYETYKNGVIKKEEKAAKEKAVRAYFESKNITGKNLELAMRGSGNEIETIEMDGDKIKDSTALDTLVSGVYADLVTTTTTKGAQTSNPPANNGGKKMSRSDIVKIKDPMERRAAIAANMEIFEKGDNQ